MDNFAAIVFEHMCKDCPNRHNCEEDNNRCLEYELEMENEKYESI